MDHRYRVTTYRNTDEMLDEVETISAPSVEAAMLIGKMAAREHVTVIVFSEHVDNQGILRSSVIQEFSRT